MSDNSKTTEQAVNAIRYAVRAQGTWAKYVAENSVTKDTVKDHAETLAGLAFPNEEKVQTVKVAQPDGTEKKVRTTYGNAIQAAKAGLNYALGKEEGDGTKATALLTSAGKKATREQVVAEWEAAQKS